jgi:hypothetical protein
LVTSWCCFTMLLPANSCDTTSILQKHHVVQHGR